MRLKLKFKEGDKVRIKPIKMFGKTFHQAGYLTVVSIEGQTALVRSEATGEEIAMPIDQLQSN
ncbi:MAG: hypothetical protein AAF518_19760 [Spirochaetota bacterium]